MRCPRALALVATVALLVGLGALGCKKPEPEPTPTPAPGPTTKAAADQPGKGMKIALVLKTMTNPFFQRMLEGAEKKAAELGAEIISSATSTESSFDDQAKYVQDMIQSKVDAILIAPEGSKEIVPVLVEAKKAGIIVINLDNRVDAEAAKAAGLELDGYVGADNAEGGYLAGKHLAEKLGGTGVVTMIEGIPSADNAIARREGFEKAMAENEGIKVIKPFQSGQWEQDPAYNIMTNLLSTHSDLTGLFCANDMMALGAMRAIAGAQKTGKITVVSYDNLEEVQPALKKGELAATIEQHPDEMGSVGVEYAVRIKNGKTLTDDEKDTCVKLDVVTSEGVAK